MQTTRMTIEARDYLLGSEVDVPALQVEICDAMRCGGGIVSFAMAYDQPLTAIISPGVPVLFETVEIEASDDPGMSESEFASIVSHFDQY